MILKAHAGGGGSDVEGGGGVGMCRQRGAVLIEPSLCLVTAVCRSEEVWEWIQAALRSPTGSITLKLNKTETCQVPRSGSLCLWWAALPPGTDQCENMDQDKHSLLSLLWFLPELLEYRVLDKKNSGTLKVNCPSRSTTVIRTQAAPFTPYLLCPQTHSDGSHLKALNKEQCSPCFTWWRFAKLQIRLVVL